MRTIELHFNHREEIEVPTDKLIDAIGYLSTWNMNHNKVEIYRDGDTDLVANYYNDEGDHKYTIGAVWHDDHYGFHS